jgi:hypothetical protein
MLFRRRKKQKGIVFINDIINRTAGDMPHMQLTKTYGNVCYRQNYSQRIAALLQKWKGGKVRNLSVGPALRQSFVKENCDK